MHCLLPVLGRVLAIRAVFWHSPLASWPSACCSEFRSLSALPACFLSSDMFWPFGQSLGTQCLPPVFSGRSGHLASLSAGTARLEPFRVSWSFGQSLGIHCLLSVLWRILAFWSCSRHSLPSFCPLTHSGLLVVLVAFAACFLSLGVFWPFGPSLGSHFLLPVSRQVHLGIEREARAAL